MGGCFVFDLGPSFLSFVESFPDAAGRGGNWKRVRCYFVTIQTFW
jgi:hypothetical protein